VIVVGHTECGGAKHCLEAAKNPHPPPPDTPLLRWLEPLTQLARLLNLGSQTYAEGLSLLIRENVNRQVEYLAGSDTIQNAWKQGQDVWIHGLIYDLSTGLLTENTPKIGPGMYVKSGQGKS
jgi:carbonic anhydrase